MHSFKRVAFEKNDADRLIVLPPAVLLTEQVTWCILLLGALTKTNRSDIMGLHHGLGLFSSLQRPINHLAYPCCCKEATAYHDMTLSHSSMVIIHQATALTHLRDSGQEIDKL